MLTVVEAQAIQNAAVARGTWLMWSVAAGDATPVGGVMARGLVATFDGGKLVGVLVADTLDALRAMLPAGLTRQEPTAAHRPGTIEVWD